MPTFDINICHVPAGSLDFFTQSLDPELAGQKGHMDLCSD